MFYRNTLPQSSHVERAPNIQRPIVTVLCQAMGRSGVPFNVMNDGEVVQSTIATMRLFLGIHHRRAATK
jgi:hypothetical protein